LLNSTKLTYNCKLSSGSASVLSLLLALIEQHKTCLFKKTFFLSALNLQEVAAAKIRRLQMLQLTTKNIWFHQSLIG